MWGGARHVPRRTSSVLTFVTMSNNDRNDEQHNKISNWENSRRQSKVTWRGGGIMTHDYNKNPINTILLLCVSS